MKYFRIHPDLLILANHPVTARRVRKARKTTPEELSTILVQTLASCLRGKKILLLTDAPDEKKRHNIIIRSCWNRTKPLSLRFLLSRLQYNFQTDTICVLYHARLFGLLPTIILLPFILLTLRITKKRVVTVFLTVPRVSTQPTLAHAAIYFARVWFQSVLSLLSSAVVTTETSFAVRSLKSRRETGKVIAEELFPSPIKDLGLINYLHPDARTKPSS